MSSDLILPMRSQQDDQFLADLETLARPVDPLAVDLYQTPGQMAKAISPMTVQTPALDIVDAALLEIDLCLTENIKRTAAFKRFVDAGVAENEAAEWAAQKIPLIGSNRLVVSLPPQEGKSTRVSQNGVLWLLRRHRNLRIALVSYQQQIAQDNMSRPIRSDIENNQGQNEYTLDLGLRLRPDNRSIGYWNLATPHTGGIYAVGIGGALTGRPVELLLIDDPVKDYSSADSLIQSAMAWSWWQSVARPRLAPNAPVIIIMTRWHEADLVGRLLQKQKDDELQGFTDIDRWHVINIPAQADYNPRGDDYNPLDYDPLGRSPGEYMISARGRTRQQWEATKNSTAPRIWSALYQGKPTPDSGDVFQRQWWVRFSTPIWTETVEMVDGEPVTVCNVHDANEVIQSWDMTFTDNKGTDFVVGQVWARKGANAYLVDQVRARMSFTATVDAFRRLSAKWPQASAKFIEDKANGPAVISTLRHEIGGIIPVQVSATKGGNKVARASAVSPFVESHNVFIPEMALGHMGFDPDAFIEECTQFPNSAHDDQVDAASQALARMFVHGSAAKDWLESLAPPCPECGQPNTKDASAWIKCGAELIPVLETPTEVEVKPPDNSSEDFNAKVLEVIGNLNPQNQWQRRWQ